ncbi:MAG TPA: molybdopterin cofactor-binding domain-containing protein [Bryobacteraceae bacterium]|nr:molybdopterin cofactor-binding domain-containing protein [Bryobacteraceae bacterium]
MPNSVAFFLNGKAVIVNDPAPDLLLIDYLRSPEVGLTGPKKPCGQGGCGGCTVILSRWNGDEPQHRAINSCLRPVCALGGLVVTTIEGTGAVRRPNPEFLHHSLVASRAAAPPNAPTPPAVRHAEAAVKAKNEAVLKSVSQALSKSGPPMAKLGRPPADHPSEISNEGVNPVAYRLAMNNGSQCGYCSVGFVMNMSEFLINNPKATKKQIEEAFDGNICRCTGYRAILTGMKTFASDWNKQDEANRMACIADPDTAAQKPGPLIIPFPSGAEGPAQPVTSSGNGQLWRTPTTLAELATLMHSNRGAEYRLVHGNTSYGVYEQEFATTKLFIDIRLIPELNAPPDLRDGALRVSGGTIYADLISLLENNGPNSSNENTRLGAVLFMARRTAGRIVRNAASLAGNSMMVLHHIAKGTGEPFPSDLFTTLDCIEATVEYLLLEANGTFTPQSASVRDLVAWALDNPASINNIVLVSYLLPNGDFKNETALAQKVALREVNAHSIVNTTSLFTLSFGNVISAASLVFGGIAPFPWHAAKTEAALAGAPLGLNAYKSVAATLAAEVKAELALWADRMKGLPNEGFTDEYRIELAIGLFYKAIVNAMEARGITPPPEIASSGRVTWGKWPESDGTQHYANPREWNKPVGQPYIKITSMYQCSGQIHYVHELPVPPLTVNAAFVQSRRALANYYFIIPGSDKAVTAAELRRYLSERFQSFIDLITHENIREGGVNLQGMGMDQPLFAEQMVNFVGQSIALAIANTEQEAIRIAHYVMENCLGYYAVDWPAPFDKPILNLEKAIEIGSVFPDTPESASFVAHIWKITRPGSRFDWTRDKNPLDREPSVREGRIDGIDCVIVENAQSNGGQAHFYMERQGCVAEPSDQRRFVIYPSTQSPMEMHQTSAMALGVHYNQVEIRVNSVGGGFGGKTEQTRFVTGPAAVAAQAMKRPVRLAVRREEDTIMIGKRHGYYGQYQIAIDRRGMLHGFQIKMWGDGGAFYDCSFIVSNCVQLRTDNAYLIKNFESQIDVCRTNTAPSTAFRSFGDVQGKNMVENAIDDAAFAIGMLPEDVRELNLYNRGDVTPFGQPLSYCYMKQVWQYLKDKSNYSEKRASVDDYNRKNKWRKRGLGMMPVKYGSGYNLLMLEQAAAVISISQGDGSVFVHQGGVEMGQGLATQVEQVASYVLNLPMEMIFVEGPRTAITPNPTSSGASTGTPYSCEAVKQTCQEVRKRMLNFGYQMREENGDRWCTDNGIDFWNYSDGWAHVRNFRGQDTLIWSTLVSLAYSKRIPLIATFTAKIRGGEVQIPAMTFKPQNQQPNIPGITRNPNAPLGGGVDSFVGFTYSAALSVVEVDILTGEAQILSSDIVYDMGWSMNPAIDIGQVEGAFVQGIGYLTSEKLVFQEDGPEIGRLNTDNTWRYKPPATTSIPLELNTHLFPRDSLSVADIPEDPNDIFSAKEVGEPPLVLANSVFFAIKAAIRASRLERGLSGLFRFDAPATVQEVRRVCEVSLADLERN